MNILLIDTNKYINALILNSIVPSLKFVHFNNHTSVVRLSLLQYFKQRCVKFLGSVIWNALICVSCKVIQLAFTIRLHVRG